LRNHKASKTVAGVTTKYVYDGDQVIAEYEYDDVNQVDVLVRKFVYGPGIDEPICMVDITREGAIYYYHYDGLGSVVALSAGDIVERYTYDVFGEPTIYDANDTVISESSVGNPYMFTGRRFDAETGLYYYRARYYEPKLGRFLQPDPIGYYGGLNLYTYCLNDPINWLDPFGLCRKRDSGPDYSRMTPRERLREYLKALREGGWHGLQISANEYSFGLSRRLRRRANSYVDRYGAAGRWSRRFGRISRDAALAAAAMKVSGIGSNISRHGPHHKFPGIGKRAHIQVNLWRKGVAGSGRVVRIPY